QSPTPQSERTFNYWLTVRKNPKLFPNSGPIQIAKERLFAVGDQIHISFSSPQSGYLYIVSESPAVRGSNSSFNTLFPTPNANQGSSQLPAGKTIRIPEHDDGFVFDAEQGTEKLWLIWTSAEMAELEALKKWANEQDRGEIKDSAQIDKLRAFLSRHSESLPQGELDKESKRTIVKTAGDILVKLIELEHY
ncbi:MAG TPA: DUF4384 domain-containing protein, partial [Blastocatellia bacterium]